MPLTETLPLAFVIDEESSSEITTIDSVESRPKMSQTGSRLFSDAISGFGILTISGGLHRSVKEYGRSNRLDITLRYRTDVELIAERKRSRIAGEFQVSSFYAEQVFNHGLFIV